VNWSCWPVDFHQRVPERFSAGAIRPPYDNLAVRQKLNLRRTENDGYFIDGEKLRVSLGGLLLLVLTAACMAVANVLMKNGIAQAGGFAPSFPALFGLLRQPSFVGGFLLTGVAALMWFRILATQKLSDCYPLFVSLTYSLITIGAFYFLHEKISMQKLLGLVIIVAGITTVARG
jgi:drug/metabolite transporter (DMT)-like permease